MTENEAIRMLKQGDKYSDKVDFTYEEYLEAIEMGRIALEEIQQYREIGLTPQMVKDLTVSEKKAHKVALKNAELLDEYQAIGTIEEFKALKEKSVAKKPYKGRFGVIRCSCCDEKVGQMVTSVLKEDCMNFCAYCGSKVDWSE